jgi:hypothetical protein
MIEVKPHISSGNILTETPDLNKRNGYKKYYLLKKEGFVRTDLLNLPLTAIIQKYIVGWKTTEADYYNNLNEVIVNYQSYKNGNVTSLTLKDPFTTLLFWINFHAHNNYNLFLNIEKNEIIVSTDFSKFRNTRGYFYQGSFYDITKSGSFESDVLLKISNIYISDINDTNTKRNIEQDFFKNYKKVIPENSKINYPSKSEAAVWINAAGQTITEIRENFFPDLAKTLIVLGAITAGVLILKDKITKKLQR